MGNVLSLARRLAKLEPSERRLAAQVANDLAGDRPRRRKNGRKRAAPVARTSKPKAKAPVRAVPPKAAAPRGRRNISALDTDDNE